MRLYPMKLSARPISSVSATMIRLPGFLETYRRYFPVPESGPHVLVVELFTPYAQAVESSSKQGAGYRDRKSTRLNSSHSSISYAVFCLKKKNITGKCSIDYAGSLGLLVIGREGV